MHTSLHDIILIIVVLLVAGVAVGFVDRVPGIDTTIALLIKAVVVIAALIFVLRAFGLF